MTLDQRAGAHPALGGTGVLVPNDSRRLLRAATFVTTKWPHRQSGPLVVRLSAGRAGRADLERLSDDALVRRLVSDLGQLLGAQLRPTDALVQRWPRSMPQQLVGHRDLVTQIRTELSRLPRIALAGASYDGVGVPACLRSGELAAQHVLAGSSEAVPA